MLVEQTLLGVRDKVAIAIDRLKAFEPPEGYYLAFSGGKDSQCIYHLAVEAGVKFDAHYNITGIDPPELVQFIKTNYPDVTRDLYEQSMFRLIEKNGLPYRNRRWCCSKLKERGGEGRVCVTGVRWAESSKRANNRKPFEIYTDKIQDKKLFNDNDEGRQLFENCMQKGKRIVNPIIDWTDEDVWEYLNSRNIEHCCLYDEGFKRLGCIGCPLAGSENQQNDFNRWPQYFDNYVRALRRFVPGYLQRRTEKGLKNTFETAEEMMEWWIYGTVKNKQCDGQMYIEDMGEGE